MCRISSMSMGDKYGKGKARIACALRALDTTATCPIACDHRSIRRRLADASKFRCIKSFATWIVAGPSQDHHRTPTDINVKSSVEHFTTDVGASTLRRGSIIGLGCVDLGRCLG